MPYKFVTHKVPSLDQMLKTPIGELWSKVNAGRRLTRDEKNLLFSRLYDNARDNSGVCEKGWFFPFLGYLKRFRVTFGPCGVGEYYAPDKTAIRAQRPGVTRVVEIK